MPRITVAPGVSLHCDVDDYLWPWEKAEPVVMLHGFARNARFWQRWIPYLTQDRRVYRPELRGFGRSDVPAPGYQFDEAGIVSDILQVLDQSGIERAHFVGESSGSIFSAVFAIEHPERVASLVLCDMPIRRDEPLVSIYKLGEDHTSAAILKYGVGEWCRQTLQYRLDISKASPELQEWYVNEMGKTPAYIAAALHDFVRVKPPLEPRLKDIHMPVLLLSGEQSKIAGNQQQEIVRALPKGKLHVLAGYGHGANVVAPQACADVARAFWETI